MRIIILTAIILFMLPVLASTNAMRTAAVQQQKPEVVTYVVIATVMTNGTGGAKLADGSRNNANSKSFAALPSKSALGRVISIFCPETGKVAKDIPICDVGPHSTKDPYWENGKKPLAEQGKSDKYGKSKNAAGIDLSLKLCKELGLRYPYKGQVVWWFNDLHA